MRCPGCLPSFDMTCLPDHQPYIDKVYLAIEDTKVFKLINKQHTITEVSFAGEGFFTPKGWQEHGPGFKYRIGYMAFDGSEHERLFN